MGQKTIFIFTASTKPEAYDKLNPYNKVVKNLQSKLLEEGRKYNINVLSSSHIRNLLPPKDKFIHIKASQAQIEVKQQSARDGLPICRE